MTGVVVQHQVADLQRRLLRRPGLDVLGLTVVRDDLVVVDIIVVAAARRRHGIGTRTLHDLIDAADRHQWSLAGTPDSSFGSSRSGLDRLYRRFGFVPNRGRHADYTISQLLVRRPAIAPSGGLGGVELQGLEIAEARTMHTPRQSARRVDRPGAQPARPAQRR